MYFQAYLILNVFLYSVLKIYNFHLFFLPPPFDLPLVSFYYINLLSYCYQKSTDLHMLDYYIVHNHMVYLTDSFHM